MPSRKRRQAKEEESEEPTQSTQRHRRAPIEEESEEEDVEEDVGEDMEVDGDDSDSQDQVVKKLVRYALACEYQRMPIKRTNITEKVFSKQRVSFKQVFELAQKQLRIVFGMQMVELPGRDRVTLKDRRAAQKTKGTVKTTTSWILTTVLPTEYRTPDIVTPASISSSAEEASYLGICSIIVAIIWLNPTNSIPDHKLTRYLSRLNAAENMPMDKTANVLAKMQKQGYIVRTVDRSGDDETVDWRVGPRGKVEIGTNGIMGLVNTVYLDDSREDLQSRLHRSLGVEIAREGQREDDGDDEEVVQAESEQHGGPSRQRSRRGAAADDY